MLNNNNAIAVNVINPIEIQLMSRCLTDVFVMSVVFVMSSMFMLLHKSKRLMSYDSILMALSAVGELGGDAFFERFRG